MFCRDLYIFLVPFFDQLPITISLSKRSGHKLLWASDLHSSQGDNWATFLASGLWSIFHSDVLSGLLVISDKNVSDWSIKKIYWLMKLKRPCIIWLLAHSSMKLWGVWDLYIQTWPSRHICPGRRKKKMLSFVYTFSILGMGYVGLHLYSCPGAHRWAETGWAGPWPLRMARERLLMALAGGRAAGGLAALSKKGLKRKSKSRGYCEKRVR